MLRSPVLVLFAALAALIGAAPSGDARMVVAPQAISPRGRVVQGVGVAVGGNRTAVLMDTYLETATGDPHDFALLARVGEGAHLGRLQRLPGGGGSAGGAEVAVGGDGTAVAAWIDDKGRRVSAVRAAIAAPGRPFAPAQTIERVSTRSSLELGGVGVTATGRAVVTWVGPDVPLPGRVAIREPGQRFGRAITLTPEDSRPVVAVAPWGTVLVSWITNLRPTIQPVTMARTLRPGAERFSAPVTLAGPAFFALTPTAVSGTGGAAVTWQQRESNDYNAGKVRMFSTLTRDGRFVTGRLPFSIAELTTGLDTLQLALPSTGRVDAVWADLYQGAPSARITSATISTSSRPPGRRSFSSVERLSASGWLASPPAVGVLGDRTVAAWSERRQRTARLRVAVRRDRGGWNAPQTVPGARSLGVAAGGSGQRVAIAWLQQAVGGPPGGVHLAWITR